MDKVISLGRFIYNTRHIVSFYKHDNPAGRLFICLELSTKVDHSTAIRYDNKEDREDDFKLLLDCFNN